MKRHFKVYFRLNTFCTYSCIGTSGKKCQNPHERVFDTKLLQRVFDWVPFSQESSPIYVTDKLASGFPLLLCDGKVPRLRWGYSLDVGRSHYLGQFTTKQGKDMKGDLMRPTNIERISSTKSRNLSVKWLPRLSQCDLIRDIYSPATVNLKKIIYKIKLKIEFLFIRSSGFGLMRLSQNN